MSTLDLLSEVSSKCITSLALTLICFNLTAFGFVAKRFPQLSRDAIINLSYRTVKFWVKDIFLLICTPIHGDILCALEQNGKATSKESKTNSVDISPMELWELEAIYVIQQINLYLFGLCCAIEIEVVAVEQTLIGDKFHFSLPAILAAVADRAIAFLSSSLLAICWLITFCNHLQKIANMVFPIAQIDANSGAVFLFYWWQFSTTLWFYVLIRRRVFPFLGEVTKILLVAVSALWALLFLKWIRVVGVFNGRCAMSRLNSCLASAMNQKTSVHGIVIYLSDILMVSREVLEEETKLYVKLKKSYMIITHNTSCAHAPVQQTVSDEMLNRAQKVSDDRLVQLILSSGHKIVGSDFMPASDESWIPVGLVSKDRLLRAVMHSGHPVLEASSLVNSCLKENGTNERATLEWLAFLRWSKCKGGLATCYDEKFGKLRIDTDGSIVQECWFSFVLPFVSPLRALGSWTQCSSLKGADTRGCLRKSAALERELLMHGSASARRFIDQRNFVFGSKNYINYARGVLEDLDSRDAMLISLIRLTGAAQLDRRYVEVVVPNSVDRVITIPPVRAEDNGNVWAACETRPLEDEEAVKYNISGARVSHRRMEQSGNAFCYIGGGGGSSDDSVEWV